MCFGYPISKGGPRIVYNSNSIRILKLRCAWRRQLPPYDRRIPRLRAASELARAKQCCYFDGCYCRRSSNAALATARGEGSGEEGGDCERVESETVRWRVARETAWWLVARVGAETEMTV
jgi:hypothetical protein